MGLRLFIFGSQFMEKMESSGYSAVKKWYRKVGIFVRNTCICPYYTYMYIHAFMLLLGGYIAAGYTFGCHQPRTLSWTLLVNTQ